MEPVNSSKSGLWENPGNQPLWIALKLKTKYRRATFDYVYDHPNCVLEDIHRGTSIAKHTILNILQAFRERDLVLFEEDEELHRRHYYINYVLVDRMLVQFKERVENYMAYIERRGLIDATYEQMGGTAKDDEEEDYDDFCDI